MGGIARDGLGGPRELTLMPHMGIATQGVRSPPTAARPGDRPRYRSRMSDDLYRLPRPDAVLFDLDGTLVDTVATRIDAWVATFGEVDLPTSREALAPLIGVDGKRLAREIAARAGRPLDDAAAESIDRRSGEIYERLNHAPRPLPGVRETVAAIEAAGLRWSIATSSRKDQVATSVDALGIDADPSIVDASHVEHAKPEPDLLLEAAAQLEVEPARCWYVGDSTWDMVAAVAAGMVPIGVIAGAAVDAAALRGAGAAAVIDDLIELASALRPR
jgi:HAD superfamily hydrolase (TIGR01509 family)